MHRFLAMECLAVFAVVAVWGLFAPAPVAAQTSLNAPACIVALDRVRFHRTLPRVAQRLADHQSLKIVALGSSSTAGAGASTSAASYPSRLAEELGRRFPGLEITMLNRGVNGEEIEDMLARLDTAVIAEKPDLVLWQVGTNSVMRDRMVSPHAALLHEGLIRLKASGADVVLIDPQYAPRVITKPNAEDMVALIASTSKLENICLFHRFAMMRRWHESEGMSFETFVSPDGLHMNDWSYACLAKALGEAIAEAATRPTATATAPRGVR